MAATERDKARWALRDDRKLSGTDKLVWLIVDTRGEDPHPSIATIAADCGISTRTVQRSLRNLEAGGWLRIEFRTTQAGDADTSRYVLLCPAYEGVVSPMSPPGGVSGDRGVVSPMSPKDQREDQRNEERPLSQSSPGFADAEAAAPVSSTEHHKDQDPHRRAAERIVAAYLGALSGVFDDDNLGAWLSRITAYLQRTFHSCRHTDVEMFAKYMVRVFRSSAQPLQELAQLKPDDGDSFVEDTAPWLAEIRKRTGRYRLSAEQLVACRELAAWAVSVADAEMGPQEAAVIGAEHGDEHNELLRQQADPWAADPDPGDEPPY
jgi:hypothetical protein